MPGISHGYDDRSNLLLRHMRTRRNLLPQRLRQSRIPATLTEQALLPEARSAALRPPQSKGDICSNPVATRCCNIESRRRRAGKRTKVSAELWTGLFPLMSMRMWQTCSLRVSANWQGWWAGGERRCARTIKRQAVALLRSRTLARLQT